MMRAIFSAAFLLLFLGPVNPAHAQVCNPSCATGQNCIYTNAADTATECDTASNCTNGNCTVSEVTVTSTSKAPAATGGATFATMVQVIVAIVNEFVIPLMYALAFLFLVIGLVRYFFLESGDEGRQKGKDMAMYGLIGLAVIFSVWGLVNLLLATLDSVADV